MFKTVLLICAHKHLHITGQGLEPFFYVHKVRLHQRPHLDHTVADCTVVRTALRRPPGFTDQGPFVLEGRTFDKY